MKTRSQISENKKNEIKTQPLLPEHHFEKPPVSSMFYDKIPKEINECVISPFLDLEGSLMQTSQNFYSLYQETARLKNTQKLLRHVVYGEFKNAEAMIKQNPQLLLQTGKVTTHTGLMFKDKTALQIALYFKDSDMVKLFQNYLDLKNIETQHKAQFPKGYKVYKKEEAEKIKEGYEILEDIFQAIHQAEVFVDNQGNVISDEIATLAINRLKEYLKPKNAIETETGQSIADILLLKAFELYARNYNQFSIMQPAIENFTYDSPKNQLAWRVIGLMQRYAAIVDIQAMSKGVFQTNQKKKKGQLQDRTLTFEIWDDNAYIESNFLSMISNPEDGLGVKYAIHCGRTSGSAGTWSMPWTRDLEAYVRQKTADFQDLCDIRHDERDLHRNII